MSISETSVTQIADWLLFRKSTNRLIVFFLGSRTGGLFNNKNFCDQVQNHCTLQLDTLNELERFYECYRVLRQLNRTDSNNILTASLREKPKNLLEHRYLASLVKEGFVNVIITTNIDSFLEEALQRELGKESWDYQIFVYGRHSTDEIIHPSNSSCMLLKIFGDLKD